MKKSDKLFDALTIMSSYWVPMPERLCHCLAIALIVIYTPEALMTLLITNTAKTEDKNEINTMNFSRFPITD